MKNTTTLKDVAREAGCGIATVSRVLNGKGPVSETARQRVLDAAQVLGFEFNETARALQSQRTRTIGCLVPSLVNPVFADAVQGLQAEVLAAGYHLILMCSDYDPEQEASIIRMLIQKNVDALALTVSDAATSAGLMALRGRSLPHCLMFNAPAQGAPSYFVDNAAASARVAQAFAAQGHHRTGFLALRFHRSDRSRQRFEGYRAACHARGMAEPLLLEVDQDQPGLGDQLSEMLAQRSGLSGIYASNDYLAIALIRAARALGRKIPQDLSVVGFDGIEIGQLMVPSLATVVTDPRAMGRQTGQHLLAALSDMQSPASAGSVALRAEPTAGPSSFPSCLPSPDGLGFEFRPGESLGPVRSDMRSTSRAATPLLPLHHSKTA